MCPASVGAVVGGGAVVVVVMMVVARRGRLIFGFHGDGSDDADHHKEAEEPSDYPERNLERSGHDEFLRCGLGCRSPVAVRVSAR